MKKGLKISLVVLLILAVGAVAYFGIKGLGKGLAPTGMKFLSVKGDVAVQKRGAEEWQEAKPLMKIDSGDRIKTPEGSRCDIMFNEEGSNIARLNQKTEAVMEDNTDIQLLKGNVLCAVGKLPPGSTFKVRTPVAVCGARSTGWGVSTDENMSKISGYEDKTFVQGTRGQEALLTSGRWVIVKRGGPIGKLLKLEEQELDAWDSWKEELSDSFKGIGAVQPIRLADRRDDHPIWQKGMAFMCWDKTRYEAVGSDEALKELADLGVEWVAISTTWYLDNPASTNIYSASATPHDTTLIHAIDTAHKLGLRVMLKPHIDLLETKEVVENNEYIWRGNITFATEEEWQAFFKNYTDFIVHYALLAQDTDVEFFCVGTELIKTTHRETEWRNVIAEVRKAYNKGPITYASHWQGEYKEIKFWDALDYAGIDAFFPLSDEKKPDFEEIKAGWVKWVKDLEEWQAKIQKPVVFPEVGYCSAEWAAAYPWSCWRAGEVDLKQQKDCYEALFETFWEKEWFYGVYWWYWEARILAGGPHDKNYTPQDKLAKDIVRDWYAKEPHSSGVKTLAASE